MDDNPTFLERLYFTVYAFKKTTFIELAVSVSAWGKHTLRYVLGT